MFVCRLHGMIGPSEHDYQMIQKVSHRFKILHLSVNVNIIRFHIAACIFEYNLKFSIINTLYIFYKTLKSMWKFVNLK